MNKLKEINGKYYQECEVVMLATDKQGQRGLIICKDEEEILHLYRADKFENKNLTVQHFYFLSNEKIKKGDNCILFLGENTRVVQVKSLNSGHPVFTVDIEDGYAQLSNLKKIIATTDLSLNINNYSDVDRLIDLEYNLPQPSKSFMQAYIKAYNESKPITKVLVEMEETSVIINKKSPISIRPRFELKVNSSDEITIKKIKDSYTRDEVIELLKKSHSLEGISKIQNWSLNTWIEENL